MSSRDNIIKSLAFDTWRLLGRSCEVLKFRNGEETGSVIAELALSGKDA